EIGHPTDKVDLIVLGGTFTSLDRGYQESFVKGCLDAMNGFVSDSIVAAQAANESAAARCIGLTIETKPDCFLGSEVDTCLALGTTRVELGVQLTHEDVLEAVQRGHTDSQSRAARARPEDACLKVVPGWCRIQRVQREIGAPEIQDGPKKGDIRLLARERLRASGRRCMCVRCREVGFRGIEPRPEALTLLRCDYVSSGGHEVFLSI